MWSSLALCLMVGAGAVEGPPLEAAGTPGRFAPFGLQVGLASAVGIGTFVAYDKADDPYYASTLSALPSWSLTDAMRLSLALSFTYEWTRFVTACDPASGPRAEGAPAGDCSDTNDPTKNRDWLSDLEVAFQHDSLLALGDLRLGGVASVALPTSRASRAAHNLVTLGLSGDLGYRIGPIRAGLLVGLRKPLPLMRSRVLDEDALADEARGNIPIARCASNRTARCAGLDVIGVSWSFTTQLTASVELPLGLSAYAALGYGYQRRFGQPLDALSSVRTDDRGDRVVTGTRASDWTSGNVELAYAIDDSFGVALGVWSDQPARTRDGQRIRFPLYDFVSPANNFTTWYLSGAFDL